MYINTNKIKMNKKINLIKQILQADYYVGNIEEGSLTNNSFTIWTQGKKHSDLINSNKLIKEIKRAFYFSFIKDDGAVILDIKLDQQESNYLAEEVFNKKDANNFDLYRLEWSDDRDFRSDLEKEFDNLLSSVELSASSVGRYKKQYLGSNNDDRYVKANYLLKQAIDFVKKAHKELV
tara:strand:+ start:14684 stop:15217 length:534 start_codon:yes stop_codon:yes gene_type:complete